MVQTLHICEVCGSRYANLSDAKACEEQPMRDFDPDDFTVPCYCPKVGDVVECGYPAYGWWKGSEEWSVYRYYGGRFITGYFPLWVVLAKIPDEREHKWRYILWSPSDATGKEAMAWTGPTHTPCRFNRMATAEEMERALAYMDATYSDNRRIPLL